jgi:hypothetical protein
LAAHLAWWHMQAWDIVPANVISRAGWLVDRMLDQTPAVVRANLVRYNTRVGIYGNSQKVVDLPEFAWLRGRRSPDGRLYDDIAGLGATKSIPTSGLNQAGITETDNM